MIIAAVVTRGWLVTRRAWVLGAVATLLVLVFAAPAAADFPYWPTYKLDQFRTGVDPDFGPYVPPTLFWQSPALDGKVYAEPLVVGDRVYVATENDTVYALDARTGAIIWQNHLGTAVPATEQCASEIRPTLGITSTPVIDPWTGRIYVVADTWDGSNPATMTHEMFGLNLWDGSVAVGPVNVEPPGDIPNDQLQRESLALDDGKVIIGYGGNATDCGFYHGWLAAAREDGRGPVKFFEATAAPGDEEGAIWNGGNAPAIDARGNIWVATGNGNPLVYDLQDSVVELDPNLNVIDWWAPAVWATYDANDLDLGSTAPLLLPHGLVFELGKAPEGYLLDASNLGGTGAPPLFEAPVHSGSRGGGVYYNGVVYVATFTGVYALQIDFANDTFAPLPGFTPALGPVTPPIVADGLVWSTSYVTDLLYGIDPTTGAVRFSANLGGFEHFQTPAATGGLLFIPNHDDSVPGSDQITAFKIGDISDYFHPFGFARDRKGHHRGHARDAKK